MVLPNSLSAYRIRIVRAIVDEVTSKLSPEQAKEFFAVVNLVTVIDENWVIPFELGEKYLSFLKKGDAAIAAYTEFVGAKALVSENRRHFYQYRDKFPFAVWDAAACLKELKKAS
ncbi:MAG: hypothetical protein HY401_05365 [Elusimicrobia bacterium]|nr:hypothetical protein [Elusimicrobiota bacterium]